MWTCAKCGEQLEDSFDPCWSCGTARDGTAPANPTEFEERRLEVAPTTQKAIDEQSPTQCIEMVRGQSCYGVLTGLVDCICGISIVVAVIAGGAFLAGGEAEGNATAIIVVMAVTALACILVIAWRQASLLLIDIAAILIEQNRKKKRVSRDRAQQSA